MTVMTEQETNGLKVKILALCSYQELGDLYLRNICSEVNDGWGSKTLNGIELRIEILAGDPKLNPYWHQHVGGADALVILARFLDVLSMDNLKGLYRSLPLDSSIPPLAVFMLREEGEKDYKLSCVECGQKLWVRDYDVGKNGRCPNCRTAFKIPAQDEYARRQLVLPDHLPVEVLELGENMSADTALGRLLTRVGGRTPRKDHAIDADIMKRSTIRIQIQDNVVQNLSQSQNSN